jgi:hypothetical protein
VTPHSKRVENSSGRCQPVDLSDVFFYDISGIRKTYSDDDVFKIEEGEDEHCSLDELGASSPLVSSVFSSSSSLVPSVFVHLPHSFRV